MEYLTLTVGRGALGFDEVLKAFGPWGTGFGSVGEIIQPHLSVSAWRLDHYQTVALQRWESGLTETIAEGPSEETYSKRTLHRNVARP